MAMNWRLIRIIGASIAGTAAGIVAINQAWSTLGLPEVATKPYVHEQVDPLKLAQADTTRAVYQLSLAQLQSSLYAAQQDQLKAPSETVTQRIGELQQQINQVQSKLNAPSK